MVAEAMFCVTLMVLVMSTTADFSPFKHGKIFLALGGKNCNHREVITTEERCIEAATELGLAFNRSWTDDTVPAGCYSTGHRICFNRIIDPSKTHSIMPYRRGLCEKDCSPPDAPDVSYGKYCGDGVCINNNTGYPTLLEAWNNCGQVVGCGFIMLYSDNKYYLRRISDPSIHGYKGYWYPENCDDLEVCVKITTGNESRNDGTLLVKMNGEITASAHYDKGDIVVDTCSNLLRDIQLFPGPCPNDAWAGHIEITRGGKAASLKCDNCSGAQYLETIVVDDDSDAADLSPTQCFGRSCSITWSMKD